MSILVSDSSVLIDLERGGLLPITFQCGHTLIVPDLLYQTELLEYNGPYLTRLGLGVVELTPDELQVAQDALNARPALSPEDSFALACATRADHVLLAGDGSLREEAKARGIPYKGLLWILDELLACELATPAVLCDALTKIAQHPRCRLPKAEVSKRQKNWC